MTHLGARHAIDRVGVFMRMTFTLDDGDTFEVDTLEMADMLRAFEAH